MSRIIILCIILLIIGAAYDWLTYPERASRLSAKYQAVEERFFGSCADHEFSQEQCDFLRYGASGKKDGGL